MLCAEHFTGTTVPDVIGEKVDAYICVCCDTQDGSTRERGGEGRREREGGRGKEGQYYSLYSGGGDIKTPALGNGRHSCQRMMSNVLSHT